MTLVDANLLIDAVNRDLPQHKAAKAWWEKVLSGATTVGIPWVSVLAFLRICTSPRIFPKPLTPEDAVAYVDGWLAKPPVRLVAPGGAPGGAHWAILRNLLVHTGTAANLSTDNHIAALALEQGYDIYSADNDFARFPGLKHINPLFPK
ncbi:type II toxin-antitoxin system VapC family toxin [Sulfuricystis multivorans]|uniref:type II toxin-antitoxin system VapC family toxin n=1 Tax=Sulfuricystis multivorans TaxID=2211108 RepID=UPI000F823AE5|nr:type II toxin-antitoxin system VapC family toxin [Sulfuricystis multivorans]